MSRDHTRVRDYAREYTAASGALTEMLEEEDEDEADDGDDKQAQDDFEEVTTIHPVMLSHCLICNHVHDCACAFTSSCVIHTYMYAEI